MNFKSSSKSAAAAQRRRMDCLHSLPGFLSQILLLMNGGMVLVDAFYRTADGYAQIPEKRKNYFTEEVLSISRKAQRSGENPISLFCTFGRSSGVKELARIGNIMLENQNRGTDLWERLEEESNLLWQERKRSVQERMRVGESKMSFPLGLLMMSLLLVTAAPAMMQL